MAIEVGSKLEGKVTGITHFGAFVELPEGGTGLVHISEIADNYVKDVNDHLKLNDMVTVKVINVDKDGKIGLSIKQAVDKPVETARPARFERPSGGSSGGGNFGGGDRGDRGPRGGGGGFGGRGGDRGGRGGKPPAGKLTFEDKVSRFLKDSEERISSLKKNTEGKRGGRGARRD
ncbi:S1 domain-containing RNA-binding protein [Paenibacillus vulneris]|uniref:S1 domain-containing RNA-binding protein n=1 Tax=Paenibacillus vulneris TaxID=1133364 RepID=A0ABW3UIP4_9BACL|nr:MULTISPECIES: S1 domain-containing RNA-binding protein [unclassified Paenibacillus]MBE1447192.1 S1 RNA binding domain protein [Paenibacillus sp. OAS669]